MGSKPSTTRIGHRAKNYPSCATANIIREMKRETKYLYGRFEHTLDDASVTRAFALFYLKVRGLS